MHPAAIASLRVASSSCAVMKMTGHFDPDAASRRSARFPKFPRGESGVWMNLRPLVGIIASESLVIGGERREWNEKEDDEESLSAEGDEGASGYSITSSAVASSVAGILSPSAAAVLRLRTSSNFVGCSTGKSAGLAPLKTLSI